MKANYYHQLLLIGITFVAWLQFSVATNDVKTLPKSGDISALEHPMLEERRQSRGLEGENTSDQSSSNNKQNSDSAALNDTLAEFEELPKPEGLFSLFWRPAPKYTGPRTSNRRQKKPQIKRTRRPFNFRARKPILDNEYLNSGRYDIYNFRKDDRYSTKPTFRPSTKLLPADDYSNEDVYSLYSAGKPYKRGSTASPPSFQPPQKPIPLWSSIMNTGSGFLKMLNPFSFFKSSPSYPVVPQSQQELRPSREPVTEYRYKYDEPPIDILRENDNSPEIQTFENHRPFYEETHRNKKYPHKYYSNDADDKIVYRENEYKMNHFMKNEIAPVDDFTHDFDKYPLSYRNNDLIVTDNDYRSPSYPNSKYNLRPSVEDQKVKLRPNNVYNKAKPSDFVTKFPLRDDLYIGKDGNIYLKDEFTRSSDRYRNGMDYAESSQENKHYEDMMSTSQKKIPVYLNKTSVQSLSIEVPLRKQSSFDVKEKAKPKNTSPHSKFALRELS